MDLRDGRDKGFRMLQDLVGSSRGRECQEAGGGFKQRKRNRCLNN